MTTLSLSGTLMATMSGASSSAGIPSSLSATSNACNRSVRVKDDESIRYINKSWRPWASSLTCYCTHQTIVLQHIFFGKSIIVTAIRNEDSTRSINIWWYEQCYHNNTFIDYQLLMNKRKLVPAFYFQFIFNFLHMEFSPTTEKLLSWDVNLSTADSNHIA